MHSWGICLELKLKCVPPVSFFFWHDIGGEGVDLHVSYNPVNMVSGKMVGDNIQVSMMLCILCRFLSPLMFCLPVRRCETYTARTAFEVLSGRHTTTYLRGVHDPCHCFLSEESGRKPGSALLLVQVHVASSTMANREPCLLNRATVMHDCVVTLLKSPNSPPLGATLATCLVFPREQLTVSEMLYVVYH